ncbi:nicotinate-nucleotide--dimethylbenzimidazole phosphoribosyltransferase [Salipiger bermudensis]|uniref:Nicotinate-nucleotide--dimethylbenzimidazole phosphoribosyltransferase n=1 Tax=Salipiger bermudensis (strain DSM 26914 / JCM 13377 / KCTC 12554 / HTCC2601) TaxID=314265 RepID=Q0FRH2_SALBH|nr:nicotinate-nucleotide--dimethylbenzimidazole phosphoribosyltransferase [Salipiger bermudensis]EAU46882.1 nicotinate-nucleotide--dimethylbenzimidazole phosphoribosyltransferase [Salipiger bermudensis HTCC2601]
MTDPLPLAALAALADATTLDLPSYDDAAAEAASARQMELTKPPGSLGRLEDLAVFLAGWQGRARPEIGKAQALVFAGNHGVCAQGVNPFPQEVTAQMVANFEHGGAAINQLCALNGAALSVVALNLDRPTEDVTQAPAMTEAETLDAMRRGGAAVDPTADVLILGEMGIGNSTIAAALAHAVFGGAARDWVGRGTGSDTPAIAHKAEVVARAVALHERAKGLQILAALGGREQAAICGAVIAARLARIPVLLDGFICTAAVAPLHAARPALLDHCLIGHASAEPGHRGMTEAMGKRPILDLGMALGEGSGAALALGVLRGALACHNGMATFAEAGVSDG